MRILHWNQHSEIENPRNHPIQTIERLRSLLAEGAAIQEDGRRRDFFEVHDEETVYYVYASPVSGKIYLVAACLKEPVAIPV